MKNILTKIALVVLVATVAAPAHAGVMDTVKGYWNSARTHASNAAQVIVNAPYWIAQSYSGFNNLRTATAIMEKVGKKAAITQDECDILQGIIVATEADQNQQAADRLILDKYFQTPNDEPATVAVRNKLNTATGNAAKEFNAQMYPVLKKIGVATAVAATCIATVYTYKRLTARKSIPGWC